MVSFIKKANRGLCLTIVILIILTGYIISVESSRKAQRPAILEACEEYIQEYDSLVVLPEKYRMNTPGVNLGAHLSKLRDSIEPYLSPSNNNLQYELETLKTNFDFQRELGVSILDSSKKITGNPEFSFHDNEVTVTLSTVTTISSMRFGDASPSDSTTPGSDTIVLEKVGDEWKIVYSILNYSVY